MKFYESHYEEYISSVKRCNLHPELSPIIKNFPTKISQLENVIFYGPPGIGKYSQVLYILQKYSPSELKYDKKIVAQTEKQQYIYHISDIHYEIDMSLLGCNSKLLWHELFFQIVDIISVKTEKIGIIVCKNFHLIHTELLEIFYSYMQQYNHGQTNIKIKFFLMMEHVSFLPNTIINACHLFRIGRPTNDKYIEISTVNNLPCLYSDLNTCPQIDKAYANDEIKRFFLQRISDYTPSADDNLKGLLKNIELDGILNIKEVRSFPLITNNNTDFPKDIFNIICDNIIKEMLAPKTITFTGFRDTLYDILTYNLDATECIWYMLRYFIENNYLSDTDTSDILTRLYSFLKYYNNNYRPIYHLESIIFYITNKIHKYNEL